MQLINNAAMMLLFILLLIGCQKSAKSIAKDALDKAYKDKISDNCSINSISVISVDEIKKNLNDTDYKTIGSAEATCSVPHLGNKIVKGKVLMELYFSYGANGSIQVNTVRIEEHMN